MYPYNIRRSYRDVKKQSGAPSFKVFASNSDNSENGDGCQDNPNQNDESQLPPQIPAKPEGNDENENNNTENDNLGCEQPDYSDVSRYVIEMIKEAIKDEKSDGIFYDTIANMLTDENDKKIMYKIHHDEDKHRKMFIEIYEMLTESSVPEDETESADKEVSQNMAENFENALFDEISAVEFYRKLYFIFLNQEIRDALFEIITDEQNHAHIVNYMYSKYKNAM